MMDSDAADRQLRFADELDRALVRLQAGGSTLV